MDISLDNIDALTGGRIGTFDAPCPECGPGRTTAVNRTRRVLRIWREGTDFATYNCSRCGLKGFAREGGGNGHAADLAALRQPLPTMATPVEVTDDQAERRADTARFLWRRRQPTNNIVRNYLYARGYRGPIPATLGYLPPSRPSHQPAMIAAFGQADEPEPGVLAIDDDTVTGIHLTLLKPDGSGKAGTERDKFMLGPSKGWPIVLAPPNDNLGLVICEGIETGLSIFQATGLGVWAAGAAGRMPALADKVPEWIDCVTIAAEADEAGQKGAAALVEALQARGLHVETCTFGETAA